MLSLLVSCSKRSQGETLNYCGDPLPQAYPDGHDQRDLTLRAQRTAFPGSFSSGAKQEEELTGVFQMGKMEALRG